MKSKRTSTTSKTAARSWIEANFQKRECIKFIPSPRDEHRCCCGQSFAFHCGKGADVGWRADPTGSIPVEEHALVWSPSRHTQPSPTDAYGTIEFQGGPHPSKAQYVRLAYDTRPELILQLFTREWGLELPKLLITVQGGKANFDLQPKLKKVLRKGLLKAAKTTGAWIFTGGTNTGVTRQVGDALLLERSQRSGRVISIGIAPWGIVENNHELLGHNRDVPYHSIASPRSKYAVLNNRHAYFLLVDNGSGGRYGAEIILRRKLEKYISNQKLHPCTHCSTPVVCLVIEGGTNTIRAVLEYVTDTPPVPVVVCDGSGRAADLLAFTHKTRILSYAAAKLMIEMFLYKRSHHGRYASETGEQTVLEGMKDYLVNTIQRTFEVGLEQAECLYNELVQCTRKKNLITVFRITDRPEEKVQELDQTILTALFKSQHLSPSEQLSLALAWNRVDIARSEIFVYGQEWPPGALDEAMMQALEHDRIDFVKLLLENGVSMRKFLSIPRLEELYNTKQGPSNTLGYILLDVRPHIPRGYQYTLHDIGLVINKLMGGAYRAHYTRRKFRVIYAKVMKKSPHVHRNSSSFIRYYGNANFTLSLLAEALPASSREMPLFDYPFNELLIWAVLTKRQQMALLMWQHGEEALAKALVACKLYKAMAHEAAEDDLETEIYEELRNYGKEFENIALDLLDFCYRQDDDQTQQLLTCELQNWSGQTCLSLAVAGNHRALLAHPCSQIILADLWMGGLRTRKNTNLKVVLGLLCPVYIIQLDFKSKEELQLMPQTEEEHMIGLEEENDSLDIKPSSEHSEMTQRNTEPDAEKWPRSVSIRNKSPSQQGVKALLTQEHYNVRDTIVQENGKVITDDMDPNQPFYVPIDYFDIKANRPLRLKKKLYEFYTAPITKFWGHSIAYILFLCLFSYVVLVKMYPNPSWQEIYTIAYICTLGCEKIREIVSSEPVAISHKFAVWAWNTWNPCDASAIIFFLIGMVLRLKPSSMSVGRVIYCVDIIYWYLRILHILGVNKYLGPLVTMMGKMIKNMIYFVVLLLVVLMSFGVCRQAILYPNNDPNWNLAKEVFFQPYFMLYGEVFADYIDPDCGGKDQPPCQTGRWITPAVMSTYLLVANILLINLLIAVFNNIFNEVNAVSHQVWMFQRFTVVMEYEQKPVLPPPLIAFCHIYLLIKFFRRKLKGVEETYDNGLKLFLDSDDLERLHDFEEECVEGYFREKETRLQLSTEERIKATNERVENMLQKVEDIDQKENRQVESVQSLEYRLRNLEDLAEKTSSHLAVIHRFMATHLGEGGNGSSAPPGGPAVVTLDPDGRRSPSEDRIRRPDEDRLIPIPMRHYRRPPTRSLTEVRPDWWPDSIGEHRHLRAPLLTNSSMDEDVRKVEPLMEGDNEDEENDKDDVDGEIRGVNSIVCHGKRTGSSHHSTSKTSLHDSLWPGEASEPRSADKEERSVVVDVMIRDDGAEDGALNMQSKSSLQLDFTSNLYERRMQQPGRDPNRRRSCDVEEEHQSDLQTHPLAMSGSKGSGKAAHSGFPRRQLSHTQSEPDMEEHRSLSSSVGHNAQTGIGVTVPSGTLGAHVTWAEPRIQVFPAPPRSMLMAMHAEYTSITDELETVCSLLSPPRTPRLLSPPRPHLNRKSDSAVLGSSKEHLGIPRSGSRTRHISEMSNPEMAIHLEKEHLRDAEECDYLMMEGVIQRRFARQRNEIHEGADEDSSAEDDLGSSSDDATELRFVAPPTRQQRLQQQYRSRSYSVGVGSGSNSGAGITFLTVTNEAPEYRCPPRLRRSSAVEMNEISEAQMSNKQDSADMEEFPCSALENCGEVGQVEASQYPSAAGIVTQCPTIFCTDADAEGNPMLPSRQRRPSITAVEDSSKSNLVTESSC